MAEPRKLRQVGERALQELARILDAPAERLIGLRKANGGWSAMIEVLEMPRVPESRDVLADYEVELSREGAVVGFRRTRRYLRSGVEVI